MCTVYENIRDIVHINCVYIYIYIYIYIYTRICTLVPDYCTTTLVY